MQPEAQKYVIFSIRDELFAAPAAQVLEVGPAPTPGPIGLWHTHGKLVPVHGLEALLGFKDWRPDSGGFAMLTHPGPGRASVAFVGGELRSVRSLAEDSIERGVPIETRMDRSCLLGIARDGEDLIQIIDLWALANTGTTSQERSA